MANTKRTVLYLDQDAAALLVQLAPSPNRRGRFVSDLIRAASVPAAQDPAEVIYAQIGRQIVTVAQELATRLPELRKIQDEAAGGT
jgi:hypothetical protein